MLPGVTVTSRATPPTRSTPTSTGPAFIAVLSDRGLGTGLIGLDDGLRDMDDFERVLGTRQSYSVDYDWAEEYFHDGGNLLYPSRVLGPGANRAALNLTGTSGTTLQVIANEAGAWANGGLKVQVINGPVGGSGTRVIVILDVNSVELERTQEFSTQAAGALQLLSNVSIIVGGGSGLPVVLAATALAGGSDDRANITQTQVDAALARFDIDLGSGQVASPNWQTDAAHTSLLAHAASRNRWAVCDTTDTTSKSTMLSSAAAGRATAYSDHGELLGPWIDIPGQAAGSVGRPVPLSAGRCARYAATDAEVSPNQAAAGKWGILRYATRVRASFSRVAVGGVIDAEDLNMAGVNLAIVQNGQVKLYGNRSLVDPNGSLSDFIQSSNCRYRMWTVARVKAIGEEEVFDRVNRHTLEQLRTATVGLLLNDYNNGDLFGDLDDDRPETAFNVDTGESVNTAATIQAGQMNVALAVRPTKGAEMVNFTITAVALTEPVA